MTPQCLADVTNPSSTRDRELWSLNKTQPCRRLNENWRRSTLGDAIGHRTTAPVRRSIASTAPEPPRGRLHSKPYTLLDNVTIAKYGYCHLLLKYLCLSHACVMETIRELGYLRRTTAGGRSIVRFLLSLPRKSAPSILQAMRERPAIPPLLQKRFSINSCYEWLIYMKKRRRLKMPCIIECATIKVGTRLR